MKAVYRAVTCCILLACLGTGYALGGELVLTGVYQGRNLFVQNPLSSNYKDYCTREVWVNETQVLTQPRASAFVVDMSFLEEGTPIIVRIKHEDGCQPKILNPQVVRFRGGFEWVQTLADENSIRWSTKGDKNQDQFFVEQLVEEEWVTVSSASAKGGLETNRYSVAPSHFPGLNRYRVRLRQSSGRVQYSNEIEFESAVEPITFYPLEVFDRITLSEETSFKILGPDGNTVIREGYNDQIQLSDLKPGTYYLFIQNRKEEFLKR